MQRDHLSGLILTGMLVAITGFILLFFSVNLGSSSAQQWIMKQGGSADTGHFHLITQSYINNFLFAGSILAIFGLMLTTISLFKIGNVSYTTSRNNEEL